MTLLAGIANQKGGVGKTTTTLNLAQAAAQAGYRVCVVDMDPQCNATQSLLPPETRPAMTMANAFEVDPETHSPQKGVAAKAVVATSDLWSDNLFLIPGSQAMAARGGEQWDGREYRLRIVMDGVGQAHDLDLIICDLPPALDQLTINGLAYVDEIHIVTAPEYFGYTGVAQLRATLERVTANLNPNLTIASVILNMVNENLRVDRERIAEAREVYGDLIHQPYLKRIETIRQGMDASAPLSAYGKAGHKAAAWYADYVETHWG